MVAAVSGSAGVSGASSTSAVKAQEDRFLKLLVAQMKNQDPLNPLDNAQVTSQMAQLSTVTGIEKLNETLAAFTKSQSFDAVGMIGHYVVAPGSAIALGNGVGTAGIELPADADSVKVNVYDADKKLVRQLDLGAQDAGPLMFAWDGKNDAGTTLADGVFSFGVTATAEGKTVSPVSLSVGLVKSVLMDAGGASLSVKDVGEIGLGDIRQVL